MAYKPKNYTKKSQQARKQQQSGASLEKYLTDIHTLYSQQGIGVIEKIPTPMAMIKGQWNFSQKVGCDFIGVYRGEAVAIESKSSSSGTAFPIYTRGKNNTQVLTIKEHQRFFLQRFQRSGGKAYVIIKLKGVQGIIKLFIDTYIKLERKALKGKRKSIPIIELEPYIITEYDYLKEVEE